MFLGLQRGRQGHTSRDSSHPAKMGKRRRRVKSESVSGAGEVSEVDLLDVDEGEEVFEHEGMVGFGMITGDPDVFVLLPDKLLLLPLDSPY